MGVHTRVCMWGVTWACIHVCARGGVDMSVHTCVYMCVYCVLES